MIIKLGSHLPDGDKNGLVRIAPALVDDPHAAHVVIAVLDCKQLATNTDDDTVTPLARIRHIEPLVTEADVQAALTALGRAFEQRTGKVELPFDVTQQQERVMLKDRPDLPEASDVTGSDTGSSSPDVDDALPPIQEEPAGEQPASGDRAEWDYPEPEGSPEATPPAGAETEQPRAFASPFQKPKAAGRGR